jgi:sulfur relay (sulfurtransferase) DsrC/TusE family protein
MPIEANGSVYEATNGGGLLDPAEWDLDVAQALAHGERLDMSDDRWTVVHFVRN